MFDWLFRYANPARFMGLSGAVLPWTAVGAALAIGAGLYLGFSAPPDYQQGSTVTLMFIHVPAALLGALFTVLALITGSLWGKPMWGTYWAWDPRLTSFLLLLFLYLGYMALWNSIEDETRAARACAVLALVGAVDLPIIYFSVQWWNTLHQGESIFAGKIAPVFLWPLLCMMLGYLLLFITLWLVRIRTMILERRARALMQEAAA
jgi:heme exporter protein C